MLIVTRTFIVSAVLAGSALLSAQSQPAAGRVASAKTKSAATEKKAAHPDVYLITIDTLRADHLPCYGYTKVKTPTLDRLCALGYHFNAYTASTITNTSHAS